MEMKTRLQFKRGSLWLFGVLFAASLGSHVAAAQGCKVVYYSGQQIENDIRKAPANEIGESEINLIERTPQHAGILLRRTGRAKLKFTPPRLTFGT